MSDCDFDFDLDCLETKQNTRYYLDIMILEAPPPYDSFDIISSSKINKLKKLPGLHKNIEEYRSTQLTSDQSTLISENGFDFSLINLSPNNRGIAPFAESDIITMSESSLIALNFFDYRTSDKHILKRSNELLEGQSTYFKIKSSSLALLNPETLNQTIVMDFISEINDSIFIEKELERIWHNPINESIIIGLREENYFLEFQEQAPDDWKQGMNQLSIIRLNDQNNIDTLVKYAPSFHNDNSYLRSIQSTKDYLLVSKDSIYIYNLDGELITIEAGRYPKAYSGINSFTYFNGNYYYNIETQNIIDLSLYVDNITSSNPYDDVILITESNTRLHIFTLSDKEVIQTISLDDLPAVSQSRSKINSVGMYHPILTSDNSIRLIYIDSYYNDDPNDDCEI